MTGKEDNMENKKNQPGIQSIENAVLASPEERAGSKKRLAKKGGVFGHPHQKKPPKKKKKTNPNHNQRKTKLTARDSLR